MPHSSTRAETDQVALSAAESLSGATWITTPRPTPPAGERPAYVFRRSFALDTAADVATLAVTAHGVYEAFINGVRVGDEELTPGFTSYRRTLHVQRFDVTSLLRAGANELTLVVSDGWFRGRCGPHRLPDEFGTEISVAAVLQVKGEGLQQVVMTDADWETGIGEIVAADLMDGQHSDLRRRGRIEWERAVAAVDPLIADTSRLAFSPAPPVRKKESFAPVVISRLPGGRQIIDFGQNLNGWVRLRSLGSEGTRTVLTHGEALDASGDLTQDHLAFEQPGEPPYPVGQVDVVVSRGVAGDVFEPRHTTHGFRYVAVDGAEADLTASDITAFQVRTDLDHIGEFTTSDERLNGLHRIAVASWHANTCDIPTDCPQRERWGYTGDFQIFARSAAFLDDIEGFARKWLRSLADDQLPSGCITNVAPVCGVAENPWGISFDGSAGWGDAATIVPWEIYRATGDAAILADHFDMMSRWVDYAAGMAAALRHPAREAGRPEPADHERWLWDAGFHWGEWLEPDVAPDFTGDKGIVATAYLSRSARIVADSADIIGRPEDAARFREISERAAAAWRAEYLYADGSLAVPTQANYVRGLAFGLVTPEMEEAVAAQLVALIEANDDRLATGFLSTGMLLPVLADHGHADVAFRVLYQEREPGWLTMLDRGATTVWEDWNGVDSDGVAHGSLSHYSKGAVITFLHEYVAGIRPLEPGYRRVEIRPHLSPQLEWAQGAVRTGHGRISSRWAVADGTVTVTVEIPDGTTGVVVLPDGSTHQAAPGQSTWSCRLP